MKAETIEVEFAEYCSNCNKEHSGICDETLVFTCSCGEKQHACSMCPYRCGYKNHQNAENCEGCIWEHIDCNKDCCDDGCPDEWKDTYIKNGQVYRKG